MSKLLKEALEKLDSKVFTEEVNTQIMEAHNAEVKAQVEAQKAELEKELTESVDTYVKTIVESFAHDQKEQFEKAVEAKAKEMSEEYTKYLDESVTEKYEVSLKQIQENLEKYASFAAEEFIKENKIAMVDAKDIAKANKIMESFSKFAVDFGTDLTNISADVEEDNEASSLKESLKTAQDEVIAARAELKAMKASIVFESVAKDLTAPQKDKLEKLAESVSFKDEDSYKGKLEIFKETLVGDSESKQDKELDESKKEETKSSFYDPRFV